MTISPHNRLPVIAGNSNSPCPGNRLMARRETAKGCFIAADGQPVAIDGP